MRRDARYSSSGPSQVGSGAPEMTLEELQQKLREMGIPIDGWNATAGGRVKSPIVERQREMLTQVKTLLEEQVRRDKEKVADLHALAQRMKHGGGI